VKLHRQYLCKTVATTSSTSSKQIYSLAINISKIATQLLSKAERSAAIPTAPNYQYQPITASLQIRILILHTPAPNDPEALLAEIMTVNIEDKPAYKAPSFN
jgi:hypothetical protein